MLGTLTFLLAAFVERLGHKAHLRLLMAGWEKRVGIVVEDRHMQFCLTFSGSGVEWAEWQEDQKADLVLRGREADLMMLFGGEELVYLRAKQIVYVKGQIRDQLKMDALLRLTC
ncbi:SCP2 sterol-binding domain-containing protein [Brevibacillus sp. H7]|uniref:SCP2 sterol-binding domain-containing protein n=1 Tax=Brevibacillus sp. H7 TaxID=3349138 RepID=UPI0037F82984